MPPQSVFAGCTWKWRHVMDAASVYSSERDMQPGERNRASLSIAEIFVVQRAPKILCPKIL
jgi:hypothetical protein